MNSATTEQTVSGQTRVSGGMQEGQTVTVISGLLPLTVLESVLYLRWIRGGQHLMILAVIGLVTDNTVFTVSSR